MRREDGGQTRKPKEREKSSVRVERRKNEGEVEARTGQRGSHDEESKGGGGGREWKVGRDTGGKRRQRRGKTCRKEKGKTRKEGKERNGKKGKWRERGKSVMKRRKEREEEGKEYEGV